MKKSEDVGSKKMTWDEFDVNVNNVKLIDFAKSITG